MHPGQMNKIILREICLESSEKTSKSLTCSSSLGWFFSPFIILDKTFHDLFTKCSIYGAVQFFYKPNLILLIWCMYIYSDMVLGKAFKIVTR